MKRLTKTYSDGTHGASDSLPCGENSYDYKNLLYVLVAMVRACLTNRNIVIIAVRS